MRAATICRSVLLHALDKGRIQLAAQAQSAEGRLEPFACPAPHQIRDPHQTPTPIPFLDLPIDQPGRHLPPPHLSSAACHPLPKMRRQSVEVEVQAVTREDRAAASSQPSMQLVDHSMRDILRPCAKLQHRDDLRERIDHHPEPERMHAAAEAGAQFVELKMREG
jgi:hypothetical protein